MINFINFISTPSNSHHKHIKRWYIISCGTLVALLASLSIVSTQQYKRWRNLDHEYIHQLPLYKKAQDLNNEYAKLSKEKSALLDRTEEWEKYTHHAKRPSDMFNAIQKNSDTNNGQNNIQSLRMVRRSVHFQMQVKTAKDGITIAQSIQKSRTIFDLIKLTSFKPANDGVEACFEGALKKT